jgi:PKD repeat protein
MFKHINHYLKILSKVYHHSKNSVLYLVLVTVLVSQWFLSVQQPSPALAQGTGTWNHSTLSDFSSCGNAVLNGTSVTNASGGEIRLAALIEDYFDGSVINSARWVTGIGNAGYGVPPQIKNGAAVVNSSWISSTLAVTTTDLPLAIEGRARFLDPNGTPGLLGYVDLGLGDVEDVSVTKINDANALLITLENNNVYANDFQPGSFPDTSGRQRSLISGFGWAQFHDFRILVAANQVDYYIDGVFQVSHTLGTPLTAIPLYLWLESPNLGYDFAADWLRLARYPINGQYTSCLIDSGTTTAWGSLAWHADMPASTSVSFETRSSSDGVNWSAWSALGANNTITSPAARYLQYRATLATSDQTLSPEIRQVVVTSASAGATPPTITYLQAVAPSPTTAQISWQANQFVNSRLDYGLTTGLGTVVTDPEFSTNHSINLTGLQTGMLYYYRVTGTNATGQSVQSAILSFTTPTNSLTQTSANDFGLGGSCNVLTRTIVSDASGGEVRLRSNVLEDYFNGTSLDTTQWDGRETDQPGKTYIPPVSGGMVTLFNPGDGARIQSKVKYSRPLAIEFRAGFGFDSDQNVGFSNFSGKWAFAGTSTGAYIYAWSSNNEPYPGTIAQIPEVVINTFNDYRIVWETDRVEFWVNGVLRSTHTKNLTSTMYVQATNFQTATTPVYVDWYRVLSSPPDGQFRSCVFDAGQQVNWDVFSRVAQIPVGTGLSFRIRTSTDGINWSAWSSSVTSQNNILNRPSGRYLQYEVNLTSSNSRLTPLLESVTVSYNNIVLTPPTAEAGGPYSGTSGVPIALDGSTSSGNGPLNYAWDLDADSQFDDAFSAAANYTWNTAGAYTVALLITDTNNLTDTDTATVTVNPSLPPTANAGGPYNGNEGASINLNGSGSTPGSGGPLTYAWDLDADGQFDDAATAAPSYTWSEPGIYNLTLLVTNTLGLTDTDSVSVTVNNLVPVANAGGPYSGSFGASIPLSGNASADPGGGLLNYAWDLDNDGQFDDAFTPTTNYNWSTIGVYSVTLQVSDTQNLTDTDVATVTITGNLSPIAADDTATVSENSSANAIDVLSNDETEVGETLTITAVSQGSNGSVVITGGGSGLAYTPSANYYGMDTFTYTISDGNGGIDTGTVLVTVIENSPPSDNHVIYLPIILW